MRKFNTSGQNIIKKHYTLLRPSLVQKGIELVEDERYFTIWAPRQTGKSTYFTLLATALEQQDYKVARINFENYMNSSLTSFLIGIVALRGVAWYLKARLPPNSCM